MGCNMNQIGTRKLTDTDLQVLAASLTVHQYLIEKSEGEIGDAKLVARISELREAISDEQQRVERVCKAIERSYEQHGN